MENKRKQSVVRPHLNLPKLNGLMGGGGKTVITNTTHDKIVHIYDKLDNHIHMPPLRDLRRR